MQKPAIWEQLNAIDDLPSPEGVALEVMRAAESEDVSIDEIARIVERDPAMSARVLKAANSPVVGASGSVGSVKHAASILGISAVEAIALGFSLLSSGRDGGCEAFDYPDYWSRSLARAVAMRHLAGRTVLMHPDEAFTYGLLGMIGRLTLASAFPQRYAEMLERGADDVSAAELDEFEIDSAQLSALLTAEWGMGRYLRALDGRDHCRMGEMLRCAEEMAEILLTSGDDPARVEIVDAMTAELGVKRESDEEILDAVVREWRTMGAELSIKTRDVPPVEQLRAARA